MTTAILTVVIGLLAGCDGDPKTLGPGYLPVSESSCLDLDSSEVLAEVKGRMGDSDYLDDLLGGVVLAQFDGIDYFSNRRINDLVAVFQTKAESFALVRLDRLPEDSLPYSQWGLYGVMDAPYINRRDLARAPTWSDLRAFLAETDWPSNEWRGKVMCHWINARELRE